MDIVAHHSCNRETKHVRCDGDCDRRCNHETEDIGQAAQKPGPKAEKREYQGHEDNGGIKRVHSPHFIRCVVAA
jgi:hypothetical protein